VIWECALRRSVEGIGGTLGPWLRGKTGRIEVFERNGKVEKLVIR
jgi:hypothetical protein